MRARAAIAAARSGRSASEEMKESLEVIDGNSKSRQRQRPAQGKRSLQGHARPSRGEWLERRLAEVQLSPKEQERVRAIMTNMTELQTLVRSADRRRVAGKILQDGDELTAGESEGHRKTIRKWRDEIVKTLEGSPKADKMEL